MNHHHIKIKLKCGRDIEVVRFEFGYTYSGLLAGLPNERLNNYIIEYTTYPSNWGERNLLMIQPNESELKNALQPCKYSAWLSSDEPLLPTNHGSDVVVIWFGELPNGHTVEEIVENGVKNIDWVSNARDYCL